MITNTIPRRTKQQPIRSTYRDVLADLRKTNVIKVDPFEELGFRYQGNGNYRLALNGSAWLIYTTNEPGRFVKRDGVKVGLWFTDEAKPDEIKDAIARLK